MKQNVLIVFAIFLFSPEVFGQYKVHVTIFYESLCPDSIRFIKNQLEPNYRNFEPYVDIEFVPFGKSKSLTQGHGVGFTCQHGPDECSGNKIHSCGLRSSTTQAQQVEFVTCQMSYGSDGSDACSTQAGLPYDDVVSCYSSDLGTELQLEAERKTKQLAAPRELLAFVPTIIYNHKYDHEKQERSLFEFRNVLCREIKLISNDLPSICAHIQL
ncbi:GILT-like protein 1 [Contarinia nasturtii]|uniref:GILT-like protein 1 n=1 Tax=Contarinia nasturtii TaxID=265458 RepID=UPI0012D3FDD3|nr:GILT-like protein 1 [Contarinia nasturtii]XP_031634104.1 GILT-like protein 1 [Contarinia nasturtii]